MPGAWEVGRFGWINLLFKMNFIGRESELNALSQGLAPSGTMRAAYISGEQGMGKSSLLNIVGQNLLRREQSVLWLCPKLCSELSPAGWASQLARDLQGGALLAQSAVNQFAQEIGRELAVLPHSIDSASAGMDTKLFEKVSEALVGGLESLMQSNDEVLFTPIFVFDDFDTYNPFLRSWIESDLNEKLRSSKNFQKSRFLFAGRKSLSDEKAFFDKFGMEQVHEFHLQGLSPALCLQLFKQHSNENIPSTEIQKKTRGNPSKVLNLASKPVILDKPKTEKMSESNTSVSKALKNFSEEEWNHLLKAAYPDRINRYALEFFCSPRDAAYCYNWIKRNRKIAKVEPDGDVILDPEIREEIKRVHAENNSTQAEEWETLSCVLNAFMGIFPNPNQHWIPVNLQLFNCFNRRLCQQIFDEANYEEIDGFLEEYQDFFTLNDKQFKMLDDVRLITSRFVEIGGVQPRDGLVEEIKIKWEEDQRIAEEQRVAMEQERLNLVTEGEQAKKQIETLGELKEKLMEDFRKPKSMKSKRVYSVSSSPVLIVLGIITIGSSLYADSIGSYYAAAGLLLTLLGFFWPNVDVKKPKMAGGASGPNLAIETQQRSLEHRISGLKNRVTSMTGSIQRITSELDRVNSGVSEPYVLEE